MSIKPLVYHPQTKTVSKLWKEKEKDNENIKKQTKIQEDSSLMYQIGKNKQIKLTMDEEEELIAMVDNLQGQRQYYIFCSRCLSYFSQSNLIKFSNCNHFFCQVCINQFKRENANKMISTSCPFGCRNQQKPEPKLQKIAQKKQPIKPSKIECGICAEYFDLHQLKNITKCPHSFCQQCINDYVKQCLKDMKEVICPEGCRGQYYSGFQLENILDKKQIQMYRKAQMIRNNLRMCSKKNCEFGILIQHEQLPGGVVQCHACYARYCKKCQWPEHEGDCNNAAQNFIQKGLLFASCPGCKRNIERNQGCNHMTCVCRYQFCYLCLGKWSHNHLCNNNSRIFLINNNGGQNGRQIARQNGRQIFRQNVRQNGEQQNQLQNRINIDQIWLQQREMRRQEDLRRIERLAQIRYEQIRRQRQRQMLQELKRKQQYQKVLQKQRERGLQIMIQFKKKKKGKFRVDDDQLHECLQKKEKIMRQVPLKPIEQNFINRKIIMNSQKKKQKIDEEKIKWLSKDKQERALQKRRNRIIAEKQKIFKIQQQNQKFMKKKMQKIMKNNYKIIWETHFVL